MSAVLVGLVSAKGSPGVTTAALALAAVGPDGLLVELDPSGGSVESWTGAGGEPGLVRVASGLRRSPEPEVVLEHVVEAPAGVRTLLAPTAGPYAESTVAMARDRLPIVLRALDGVTAVVDAGRWSRSHSSASRITSCDVVAVVCAPTIDGVEAARWLIEPLQAEASGRSVVSLVVGDRPYPAAEVAAAMGVKSVGSLPWDQRGLASLLTRGAGRAWERSPLARSARSVLANLTALAPTSEEVAGAR